MVGELHRHKIKSTPEYHTKCSARKKLTKSGNVCDVSSGAERESVDFSSMVKAFHEGADPRNLDAADCILSCVPEHNDTCYSLC